MKKEGGGRVGLLAPATSSSGHRGSTQYNVSPPQCRLCPQLPFTRARPLPSLSCCGCRHGHPGSFALFLWLGNHTGRGICKSWQKERIWGWPSSGQPIR